MGGGLARGITCCGVDTAYDHSDRGNGVGAAIVTGWLLALVAIVLRPQGPVSRHLAPTSLLAASGL